MRFRWLLALPLIRGEKIIKNINVNACRNCMYYKPSTHNDFTSHSNKCEKFGTKDIVTDEIYYDFADSCRKEEEKCGKEGKHFTLEENLPSKMISHFIAKNSPYFFALMLAVLPTMGAVYIKLNS